jgi:quinol monooxygenase YgiN
MPDLPWTSRGDMEPGHTYLVMASHLPLARLTATIRFFRAVAAIRKQLRSADGLVGYTLRARPLSRNYWTLSVWSDRAALQQFMRTAPHVGVMGSLRPFMRPTKFVQWEITATDGQPGWADALDRLARE